MKFLLLTLFTTYIVNAESLAERPMNNSSLYLTILFLILSMISVYAFYVRKCDKKNLILQEKEKEIIALHQHHASKEKESLQKESHKEKEILSLNHTIADLERKLKEGTKNQVVAKIEALQKRRKQTSTLDT